MTVRLLGVLAACVGAAFDLEAQATKPAFTVTMDLPRATPQVGKRIPLIVTLTNTSSREIEFMSWAIPSPNEVVRWMGVAVYDADGRRVLYTDYGIVAYAQAGSRGKPICCSPLKPGGSYMEESDLNIEFDLSRPGRYTAQAARRDVNGSFPSNKVSFTLVADEREAEPVRPSFTINISGSGASFAVGSPIMVTAAMTNVSGHNVPVREQINFRVGRVVPHNLAAQVLDSHGRQVPETEYGKG
jgi:hypothetical protein